MEPVINELARVYGLNSKDGQKQLKDLAFSQVSHDVKDIGEHMKKVFATISPLETRDRGRKVSASAHLTEKILASARAPKLVVNFTGTGPTLERQGSYDEISVVKPSPDANPHAAIREKNIPTNTSCGFHRTDDGNFSVVLCSPGASHLGDKHIEVLPSLELLSLSRKATTAGGRKFDQVLKGRAQFRAATEDIATIGAWSAFFLFYMGTSIMNDCNRRGQGQACYAAGLALWGIAGLTVIFSGTVWLIGRSSNPAADSRFIHLMYESAWLRFAGALIMYQKIIIILGLGLLPGCLSLKDAGSAYFRGEHKYAGIQSPCAGIRARWAARKRYAISSMASLGAKSFNVLSCAISSMWLRSRAPGGQDGKDLKNASTLLEQAYQQDDQAFLSACDQVLAMRVGKIFNTIQQEFLGPE